MPKISEYFALGVTQPQLDFVDTHTERDVLLFVDPYAISLREDDWSNQCLDHINSFFQTAIDLIHSGDQDAAKLVLSNLKEPKETGLGYGRQPGRGRGVSGGKALDLYSSLSRSRAAKTGLLTDMGEFDLFIEGIGPDGLSDITTNILKRPLIAYTQTQCRLWGIPMRDGVAVPRIWDIEKARWTSDNVTLPIVDGLPLIMVPKFSVRRQLTLSSQEFYSDFVLDYLEQEEIRRGSALVETIKSSGRKKVTKKNLKKKFEFSKDFLAQFATATPEVLKKYKDFYKNLPGGIGNLTDADIFDRFEEHFDPRAFALALIDQLTAIKGGPDCATQYHRFMVGVFEFIFYPNLIYPTLEADIHEGRKRVDIFYTNSSQSGLFQRMQNLPQACSQFVPVELKNYTREIKNPELDQISGRFSRERGFFGIICCRKIEDKAKFVERCRDTAKDGRGIVLPLDDDDVIALLTFISEGRTVSGEEYISRIVQTIVS
jgi:hypothetical protein